MDKEYWRRREFVEFCFRKENKIKQAIKEKRLDPNRPRSSGHGSGISKPTEIEAINNVTPLDCVVVDGITVYTPELWCLVVTLTKEHYNYRQGGVLYALRYQNHKKNTRKSILDVMKIGRTRYHQLIIEIVGFAIDKAESMDLKFSAINSKE